MVATPSLQSARPYAASAFSTLPFAFSSSHRTCFVCLLLVAVRSNMKANVESKTGSYPLSDDYFPDIQLTKAQIKGFEAQMELTVKSALVDYELHEATGSRPKYGNRWKTLGRAGDLTAIRQSGGTTQRESRIFGRLNGDYRNYLNFFYADTSRQLFANNQLLFGNVVDAAVLHNIHTSSSDKPHLYLGIKWACEQPFTLGKKHDMCFLEYMAFAKDLRGRDIGVHIHAPLNLAECPPMPENMKTSRIQMQTVTIVRPTDDTARSTELFFVSQNEVAGFHMHGLFFKRFMGKINKMAVAVDSKLIAAHGTMEKNCWADKKSRSECRLCSRDFTSTRHRQHCRLCGEVFCRQCLVYRGVRENDGDDTRKTFHLTKAKFCRMCVANIRDLDASLLAPGTHAAEPECEKSEYTSTKADPYLDSGTSTMIYSEQSPLSGSLAEEFTGRFEVIRPSNGVVYSDDESERNTCKHCGKCGVVKHVAVSPRPRRSTVDSTFEAADAMHRPSGPRRRRPTRTISQCIEEQEVLLQRLFLAARESMQF
ncbi:hypothetical protein BBJ28_00003824 [Nothophytophthora sp. Chile5]|nr:hypothetical protein BBJ28_00003824 [Nothophytophthora sp. Chile5]